MERSLLVYSTVDGQTQTICKKIGSLAINTKVDIVPISEASNLEHYKIIVIGASIRYGKYRDEVYDFIENNLLTLNSKNNAFFSVNAVARKKK